MEEHIEAALMRAGQQIDALQSAERRQTDALLAMTAERDRLRALTFCGCGDQFSAHDPGTCGACVAGATCGKEIDRQTIERLTAECDRLREALIACRPAVQYARLHAKTSMSRAVLTEHLNTIDAAAASKGQV